jgi:hypothetical protein
MCEEVNWFIWLWRAFGGGSSWTWQWTLRFCFLFTTMSRLAPGPTCSPVQWVLGLFPGGKTAGVWSWPPTPSSAKVKNAWSYTSTPPIWLHCVVLSCSTWTALSLPFSKAENQLAEMLLDCQERLCSSELIFSPQPHNLVSKFWVLMKMLMTFPEPRSLGIFRTT